MTAKEEILQKIDMGFNTSRKLTDETQYAQEYIRRVVNQLVDEGLITISREPRGNTYAIKGRI